MRKCTCPECVLKCFLIVQWTWNLKFTWNSDSQVSVCRAHCWSNLEDIPPKLHQQLCTTYQIHSAAHSRRGKRPLSWPWGYNGLYHTLGADGSTACTEIVRCISHSWQKSSTLQFLRGDNASNRCAFQSKSMKCRTNLSEHPSKADESRHVMLDFFSGQAAQPLNCLYAGWCFQRAQRSLQGGNGSNIKPSVIQKLDWMCLPQPMSINFISPGKFGIVPLVFLQHAMAAR